MPDVPKPGASTFTFKAAITQMVQKNASDLLLKVGRAATIRVNGELLSLEQAPLKPEELKSLAEQIMTPRQVKEFAEHKEADFAIGVPGGRRFRPNAYHQRAPGTFPFRPLPCTSGRRSVSRAAPAAISAGASDDRRTPAPPATPPARGHLWSSPRHPSAPTKTTNRGTSSFPPHQHDEVRHLLSTALQAII